MYYYNARYYDPELCRFIQADTVLDGLNRYTYCHNNPINYNDPTGMITGVEETVTFIVVGAAAIWGLGMLTSPSFRAANASFAEYMAESIDNAKQKAAEFQKESDQNLAAFKIVGIKGIIDLFSKTKSESKVEGVEDETGKTEGETEVEGAEEGETKTKGTRVNPDGTVKNPVEQLEQIEKAQKQWRKGESETQIDSTEKSKQNVKNWLDSLDIDDIDDLSNAGY